MAQPLSLTCRHKVTGVTRLSYRSPVKTFLLSESGSVSIQLQQHRQSVALGQRTIRSLTQYSRRTTSLQQSRFHCRPILTTTAATTSRSQISSAAVRCYHSRFHPRLPTHEYTNSQTAILTAALEHIPEHGFTKEALTLGARDVGFLDVSVQLFTRQEMDLILFWLASRRGLLRAKVEKGLLERRNDDAQAPQPGDARDHANSKLNVDEKVRILVLERLKMNEKIVHRWQDVSQIWMH